jgi:predicted alpha/beta-fold hydrolase
VTLTVTYCAYYWFFEVAVPKVTCKENAFNEAVKHLCPTMREPHFPHFFLWNRHLQIILGTLLVQHRVVQKFEDRKILSLEDGATLALDFAGFSTAKKDAPTLVILHG